MKVYIVWEQYSWQDTPELRSYLTPAWQRSGEHAPAQSFAGSFDTDFVPLPVNRTEMVNGLVESLRKEQGTLQAQITIIDRKINDLLSIEHKPEEV